MSRKQDRIVRRAKKRDQLVSRAHGERIGDIDAACRVWMLKNIPGYKEELENCCRGITFGRFPKKR
jgi:hypothetical protein